MPNIKSAKKRMRQAEKRRLRNRSRKSFLKTLEKKVRAAIDSKDKELSTQLLNKYYKEVEKAASKNIIHKNKAARKKSILARLYNLKFAS